MYIRQREFAHDTRNYNREIKQAQVDRIAED